MSRHSPTLLALALAAALSATPVVALAQQVHTSAGVRTLPRTDGFRSEAQYQQAMRVGEGIVEQLLADIAAIEKTTGATSQQVGALAEDVKRANREYELAKASFDVIDKKYLADLAAFQQSQVALEGEVQRQRQQAAVLEALPSAQRDYAEVSRLNDWATKIANQRKAIETERTRLLADHANVESERTKLEQKRRDAEAKLGGRRDQVAGTLGSSRSRRIAAYGDLRVSTNYLRQVFEERRRLAAGRTLPHSVTLDQAELKLRNYDAEPKGSR
jgi:hypothetical protein